MLFLLLELDNHQEPFTNASETVASRCKPVVLGPESPMTSIKGPRPVQLSSQKLAVIPDATSQITNCLAVFRILHKVCQIQLPELLGSKVQKFSSHTSTNFESCIQYLFMHHLSPLSLFSQKLQKLFFTVCSGVGFSDVGSFSLSPI
ncbi:Uncharacterized protein Rs2_28886 [Raphanus sativus]|nr:Uncharacterized protein Rs2_28886 [Raphanus sativus]